MMEYLYFKVRIFLLYSEIEKEHMITSTISSKGQVTIPKEIREFLKVGTSEKIIFIPLEEGKVLLTNRKNPAAALFGMLNHRRPVKPVSIKEMDSAISKRRAQKKL
jgi:antitoxin PrlF